MNRRAFLAAGGALALGACAAPRLGEYEPTVVEAPQWRAGDSWTFRRIDGYNGLILIRRTFNFGARDPFTRRPLVHDETEWYVPELRGTASLRTDEWLQAPPGGFSWPGYRFVYTLDSFRLP